jgi:Holliday junction DNA helicase RuvA
VSLQEAALLTRVPGIGKKTAERLLLVLKDKFTLDSALSIKSAGITSMSQDVLNALIALGYNERESLNAVKSLETNLTVNDGIKQALKYLSKG